MRTLNKKGIPFRKTQVIHKYVDKVIREYLTSKRMSLTELESIAAATDTTAAAKLEASKAELDKQIAALGVKKAELMKQIDALEKK